MGLVPSLREVVVSVGRMEGFHGDQAPGAPSTYHLAKPGKSDVFFCGIKGEYLQLFFFYMPKLFDLN